MSDPSTPFDLAEELVPVAAQLVGTVHTWDEDGVADVLGTVDTSALPALCIVLAAMVDPEKTNRELLRWLAAYGAPVPLPMDDDDDPPVRVRRGTPPHLWPPELVKWHHARWRRLSVQHTPEDRAGYLEHERRRATHRRHPTPRNGTPPLPSDETPREDHVA